MIWDVSDRTWRFNVAMWDNFMVVPLGGILLMLLVVSPVLEYGMECVTRVMFALGWDMDFELYTVGMFYALH